MRLSRLVCLLTTHRECGPIAETPSISRAVPARSDLLCDPRQPRADSGRRCRRDRAAARLPSLSPHREALGSTTERVHGSEPIFGAARACDVRQARNLRLSALLPSCGDAGRRVPVLLPRTPGLL